MLRVFVSFVAGLVAGAIMLFVFLEIAGGWYTYHTIQPSMCSTMLPRNAQVVVSNHSVCHYRLPRWDFFD